MFRQTEACLVGTYSRLTIAEAAKVMDMVEEDAPDVKMVPYVAQLEQAEQSHLRVNAKDWPHAFVVLEHEQHGFPPFGIAGLILFERIANDTDSYPTFKLRTWFVRQARLYNLGNTVCHDAQLQLSKIFGVDPSHIHFHATVQEGNHRPFFQPSAGQVGQWRHTETGGQPEVGHPAQWHHDASH
jgi:hypothetical protein